MGKRVNQTELAEIHGVSDVTIWEWQKDDGFPILQRGERGEANYYDTAAVFEWRVRRALVAAGKAESSRDREARLRGDDLEIELEKKRGTIVSAADVEPVWSARVLTAAAYQMSRASRLAGIMEATPGIEAKREILKKEDAAFLTRLGVNAVAMQQDLQELLNKVSKEEADAFMRRLAAYDEHQGPTESTGGGVGAAGPAQEN